jgi:hypothetical protein
MSVSELRQDRYPDSPNGNSVEAGLRFQDYMMRRLLDFGILTQAHSSAYYQLNVGESPQQVEFKLDNRCNETGRLSIEIAERRKASGPWVPSGIYAAPGSFFYLQGNYVVSYLFLTKFLREYHQGVLRKRYEELPTVRKFYLSLRDAEQLCARKIMPEASDQIHMFFPSVKRP